MAIISSYADDPTTTDADRYLTYAADGTTKLTPASKLNQYVGPGWTIASDTWSFSSYNSTTGVGIMNATSGANTRYSVGMWLMFTQPTLGVKYAKITSVATSTITLSMQAGTILSNEAISLPFYSAAKSPLGSTGKIAANEIDFTGSSLTGNGGIWWEEIGRFTATGATSTLSVTSLPLRKFLRVFITIVSVGGTVTTRMRFNNDVSNSYATEQGGGTAVNQPLIDISGATAVTYLLEGQILNIANQEKFDNITRISPNTAGAANPGVAPSNVNTHFKWSNIIIPIDRIDILGGGGTGNYGVGSELIVMGRN